MKQWMQKFDGLILCVFEILVGVLLLIDPVGFTSGIIIACGAVLLVAGFLFLLRYFRTDPVEAAAGQTLLKGLLMLLFGAFCAFCSGWFIQTFKLLTILYGLAVLIAGVSKVQWTVDALRLKKDNWRLPAISAAVSLLVAAVILLHPFTVDLWMWRFTGCSLIGGAILDIMVICLGKGDGDHGQAA